MIKADDLMIDKEEEEEGGNLLNNMGAKIRRFGVDLLAINIKLNF